MKLRAYDVPGMTQVAPEAQFEDRGSLEAFAGCTGELRSTHTVVSIQSPFLHDASSRILVWVVHRRGFAKRKGGRPVPRCAVDARGRACITTATADRAPPRRQAQAAPSR